MAVQRMRKNDPPQSFGTFKPVGHAVFALPDDPSLDRAVQALKEAGFADQDLLRYGAGEQFLQMDSLLEQSSGTAEFGHEVVLMRQYRDLAAQGCRWLVVYAPSAESDAVLIDVAQRCGARLAVKYHRLVTEDLL